MNPKKRSIDSDIPVKLEPADTILLPKKRFFGPKEPMVDGALKKELKSFHSEILEAYKKWMQDTHGLYVTLETPPSKPGFAGILSGQGPEAMVQSEVGTWPLVVKTVYQAVTSDPKTVEEIASGRDNSYLFKDEDGIWQVKKGSAIWYTCLNMCALYGLKSMCLLVYNPKNMDFMTVEVDIDKASYMEDFEKLHNFLKNEPMRLSLWSFYILCIYALFL